MSGLNWEQLLQIESDWVKRNLKLQVEEKKFKTQVRGYTIPFSGTKNSYEALVRALGEIIGSFHFSKGERLERGMIPTHMEAAKIFGHIEPSKDGKYGELLLYALVESVLKCPMVAHKIPTSFKDQVKGGDGIFIGKYECKPGEFEEAILIGESKIWQHYSTALDDSLLSLNRFHDSKTRGQFVSQELIVARKGIATVPDVDVEKLYKYLSPETEEYKGCVLVHPVFIMYETSKFNKIEFEAISSKEAEELIKKYILSRHTEHVEQIKGKCKGFPELQKIYLDFFILPVKNVNDFREEMYYQIHGVPYARSRS